MKKIYLIGLFGLSVIGASAQNAPVTPANTRSMTIPKQQSSDIPVVSPVSTPTPQKADSKTQKFGKAASTNTMVGKTFVANQTNNSAYRRVIAYPDGKVSVVWTASTDNGSNGFLSRGTGYNHFNGTTWSSTPNGVRIEDVRTGFPCITVAPSSAKEIIVSHRVDTAGKSGGLVMNTNASVGSTSWTSTPVFTPPAGSPSQLWPRAEVSGDYMIVIGNFQDSTEDQPTKVIRNGVESPLVYSRYKFSTSTWVDQELTLPGYDSDLLTEGSSDNYSMDASGNNVAILVGGVFNSLVLWKSTDNGGTWARTILDTFPVHHYHFDKDTLKQTVVNNGSVHVMLDAAGMAHVFSGQAIIQDSIMGDALYTYSYARYVGGINDAILYWNEVAGGPLRVIATDLLSPINGDSAISAASFTSADRRYGISNSTWPSAGMDAAGNIFLVYSALTVGDETSDPAAYRDILVTYSADHGATWSTPQNASQFLGFNREEAYPNCAKFVNDKIHISYLKKLFPGGTVPTTSQEVMEIHYLALPVAQVLNGTVGVTETANKLFTINQNYPNPFSGTTSVDVNFVRSTDVTVKVIDLTGKEIFTSQFENVPSGNSTLELNVGSIPAGMYFYSIEAEGLKATGKMLAK